MKKTIVQGLVLILLFFVALALLMQADWVKIFKIKKVTQETEEKLGTLFWNVYKMAGTEGEDQFLISSVDSIIRKVCKENEIDFESIHLHVLMKDDINAFALPNGHLILYSGLISAADNTEALAGVICHELAHIQLNHVMKKLVKEVGLSVLISMTTGNGSGEIIKETAKLLSSTSFDRRLEKEADIKAIEYLEKAKIDPSSFANFLFQFSEEEKVTMDYISWISTHPDSRDRAEYIIENIKNKKIKQEAVLHVDTWKQLEAGLAK